MSAGTHSTIESARFVWENISPPGHPSLVLLIGPAGPLREAALRALVLPLVDQRGAAGWFSGSRYGGYRHPGIQIVERRVGGAIIHPFSLQCDHLLLWLDGALGIDAPDRKRVYEAAARRWCSEPVCHGHEDFERLALDLKEMDDHLRPGWEAIRTIPGPFRRRHGRTTDGVLEHVLIEGSDADHYLLEALAHLSDTWTRGKRDAVLVLEDPERLAHGWQNSVLWAALRQHAGQGRGRVIVASERTDSFPPAVLRPAESVVAVMADAQGAEISHWTGLPARRPITVPSAAIRNTNRWRWLLIENETEFLPAGP